MNQLELRRLFEYKDGQLIWKDRHHGGRGIKAGDTLGYLRKKDNRVVTNRNGRMYQVSRLIWTYFNGPIPEGLQIDHINRDRSDNRIENLRLATTRQNAWNMSARKNRDLPKNIAWDEKGQRYVARVTKPDGTFRTKRAKTLEEAKVYADLLRLRYHGEFAHG